MNVSSGKRWNGGHRKHAVLRLTVVDVLSSTGTSNQAPQRTTQLICAGRIADVTTYYRNDLARKTAQFSRIRTFSCSGGCCQVSQDKSGAAGWSRC